MSSSDLPDYVQRNVAHWTEANANYTDAHAEHAWAQEEIAWGVWQTPESELDIVGDVDGLDVVELGCGTAYFSAWLARRGARVVGVDPTPAQLETARRMQEQTGLEFPPERLVRPLRDMVKIEWPDTQEVEFHLPPGKLIDLLRDNGLDVERMIELYAPKDAQTHEYYKWVTADWARQWPHEEIWVARKRNG